MIPVEIKKLLAAGPASQIVSFEFKPFYSNFPSEVNRKSICCLIRVRIEMKLQTNDLTSNINEKASHPCYFHTKAKDKLFLTYKGRGTFSGHFGPIRK